ncbi:MAG: hypothetical protein JWM81_895 [Candidatus Saccharibacteria bacterium]|nr:hypothetical protein [Candidatus Saccharibacteria bacterium]
MADARASYTTLMRLSTLTQKNNSETTWHVAAALVIAVGLQLVLKDNLAFGSKYALAALEGVLLVIVLIPSLHASARRLIAILLVGFITVANVFSLALVIKALFSSGAVDGRQLLISSVAIYLTNIIVFGILYWELDNTKPDQDDFAFPQASLAGQSAWRPTFFDYLYVSITNATAFSPTDTLPLTHRAKLLMTIQSITSLVTVALVAARAVNILS